MRTHRPSGWLEQAMKWAKSIQDKNAERAREAEARRLMAMEDRDAGTPNNLSNPTPLLRQISFKNLDENMSE